jgi:hypothetical protein
MESTALDVKAEIYRLEQLLWGVAGDLREQAQANRMKRGVIGASANNVDLVRNALRRLRKAQPGQ